METYNSLIDYVLLEKRDSQFNLPFPFPKRYSEVQHGAQRREKRDDHPISSGINRPPDVLDALFEARVLTGLARQIRIHILEIGTNGFYSYGSDNIQIGETSPISFYVEIICRFTREDQHLFNVNHLSIV